MDEKYGNNNMGVPDDPQLLFLFKKRRAQENEKKLNKAVIINPGVPKIKNFNQKKINEVQKKEEIISLNEDEPENEMKQNAKTKKKREGKEDINNKETKNEKKIVDNDLYNKLSMLMDGMNNKKKKKK